MRCKSLVLALTAVSGIASAQPGPPSQPPPPPMDTTTPTQDSGSAHGRPAAGEPEPSAAGPAGAAAADPRGTGRRAPPVRDCDWSWHWLRTPTSLETPNITSARLRLTSGLTFEPVVRLANTSRDKEMPTDAETDKPTAFGLGVLVRLPIVTHGHVDLEVLGSRGFTNTKYNPEGDYNTTTTNKFDRRYGVASRLLASRHWHFSMSVTNPLIYVRPVEAPDGGRHDVEVERDDDRPDLHAAVFMMIHLYN